jgi:hypothetical protein
MAVLKSALTQLDHIGVVATVDTVFPVMAKHVQISMNAIRKNTTANKVVSIPEEDLGVPAIWDIN